jgi:phosphatidate cytidylyltransferase
MSARPADPSAPSAPGIRDERGALHLRMITGIVTLVVVMLLIWLPHSVARVGFTVFVALIAGVGMHEYANIVRARGVEVERGAGVVLGVLIVLASHFGNVLWTNVTAYLGFVALAAIQILRGRQSIAELTAAVFGVFYVGWFAGHFLLVRTAFGPTGAGLITLLLVAVVLTDSAAYFVGRAIGKHKLTPISPKKTWEGAVGGFVFSMFGVALLYYLRRHQQWQILPDWTLWQYASAGVVLSITSQVGDIAESMLKRDAGVKDSGAFFPGHGGVLDRCDGFLFAAPVLYYMTLAFAY